MERQGEEVHIQTDEVRGGESQGTMRWVLGVGLFLTIALLSIIWITGALTQGDVESEATVSGKVEAARDDGDFTDSIVSGDADVIEGTEQVETAPEE